MVFEFKKDTDIGLYKKYRFFYVTDVSTTPQLPKTGQNYTGVKMAFPSRDIDKDCHVIQTNGGLAERHTYPAIISYSSLESTLHIENEERHITPEERENQLISYTMDLVEQRLLDGTASSQETTHFLKLAAQKEKHRLEKEKLANENKLLQAKTEDLQRQKNSDEFHERVLAALRNYNGQGDPDEYEDY
jgi:uncharacterized protein (DUF3084 family)